MKREPREAPTRPGCMDKCTKMGRTSFKRGWLEHPRRWLGAQWTGIYFECAEPPGARARLLRLFRALLVAQSAPAGGVRPEKLQEPRSSAAKGAL